MRTLAVLQSTSIKTRIGISFVFALLLGIVATASPLVSKNASAASLANWNAGRIIDDAIFTNFNSMSVSDIQQFLNSKVPSCDTWGSAPSEFGGGTRAQWAASKGYSAPFTCLRDYSENGKSAAQIIYDKAREFQINPQVLIVLLQKEQSLVTDTWPLPTQYKTAAGYGCPDTAPCDSQYFGLTNQLTWSSRMFRAILNASPTWYTPYVLGNNYIQYNPTSSCGGSIVNIQNRSTQALYNYTPYQPNQDALNAGYGSAYCGAYGNRNFYLYFNDWFGSSQAVNGSITITKPLTTNASSTVSRGQTITASFEVSNSAEVGILAGGLGICARLDGAYYDFGYADQTLIPGRGSVTVSYSKTIDKPGTLDLFTCSYHASIGGWASAIYPYNPSGLARTLSLKVQDNPLITSGVTLTPTDPGIGQPVTASVTIQNNSSSPVDLGMLVIAARDANGNNVDFPADANLVVPANSTITYSKSRSFTAAGQYSFFIANFKNNNWDMAYPTAASNTVNRRGSFEIKDSPLIVTSTTISPTNPVAGQDVTASLTIRNTTSSPVDLGMLVIAARDANGNNVDFPADANLVVPANSTITYSKSRSFASTGKYNFFVANFKNNNWSRDYPKTLNSSVKKDADFTVRQAPIITTNVSISTNSSLASSPVSVSFTLKNDSNSSVNVGRLVVAARAPNGSNVDFPSDESDVIIPANTSYTYTKSRTMPNAGTYSFFVVSYRNGTWDRSFPVSDNSSLIREGSFTLR
jgi:fructose-specific component phosphotransferase system IIB-like protein